MSCRIGVRPGGFKSRWPLLVLVAAFVAWGTPASGTLIFYTTRPAFDAAFPGLPIEDFEGPSSGIHSTSPPLSSTTATGPYAVGDILPGITFTTTSGDANSLLATNSFGPPSIALFNQQSGLTALLIVDFGPAVNAAGMDLFIITGGASLANIDLLVYSGIGGTTLEGSTTVTGITPGSSTPGFIGVSSTVPITRLTLGGYTGSTGRIEGIDNLAFDAAAEVVPEPGAFQLALLAVLPFLFLAVRRRRR